MNYQQGRRNEDFQDNINKSNNQFQQKLKQMEIEANIITQSRIEWIQSARNTTVDFINACYNLIGFMDIVEFGESKQERREEERVLAASIIAEKKASEKFEAYGSDEKSRYVEQGNVQKYGTLLTLYFGHDDAQENEFIVYLIEVIITNLAYGNALFENNDIIITEAIEDLKDALRAYYKVEWKRASGSIKDKEVNEKLNSEAIYKYVKDKYELPFKAKDDSSKKDIRFKLEDGKYEEV